jgi:hypothetical protein
VPQKADQGNGSLFMTHKVCPEKYKAMNEDIWRMHLTVNENTQPGFSSQPENQSGWRNG